MQSCDRPCFASVEERFQVASTFFFGCRFNLFVDHFVVTRRVDRAEDADRLGETVLETHPAEQVGQTRLGTLFVVEKQVVFGDALAKFDHLGFQAVEADALVAGFTEYERLTVLKLDGRVELGLAVLRVLPSTIIKNVTVLVNLDERGAVMFGGSLEGVGEVFDIGIDATGNKSGFAANRKRERMERVVDRAHGGTFGDLAERRGGRILPLGQAVNAVVEQDDVEVHVAADAVHQVVATDRKAVAVAGDDPHHQVGAARLEAGRYGRRATVDRVHAVSVHVIRKAARAADARDEHNVLARDAEGRHDLFHLCKNRIVTTAGTPTNVLVAGKVGRLEDGEGGFDAHGGGSVLL